MKRPAIKAVEYELGENVLSHEELCARFGRAVMDKVLRVSGIRSRRVAGKSVCASDMAFLAAEKIFESGQAKREDIDLLIMATQSPDYLLPTTACILQDRLGLKKTCAAFDINLGCSQYVYALSCACAYLKSSLAKNALILTGDTPTKTINPMDKSAAAIFGDAASATYLEMDEGPGEISDFVFGTDGSGYKDLILPTSGFRRPPTPEDREEFADADGNIRSNSDLYVNGLNIFTFAHKAVFESVNRLLAKNSLKVSDIDIFIFHQAGEMLVNSCARRLSIPREKIYCDIGDIGNCGGSSVPIALARAVKCGALKEGMRAVLCAFGVGLSWGAALFTQGKIGK